MNGDPQRRKPSEVLAAIANGTATDDERAAVETLVSAIAAAGGRDLLSGPRIDSALSTFAADPLWIALFASPEKGSHYKTLSEAISLAESRNLEIAEAVRIGFFAGVRWGAGRIKVDQLPEVIYAEERMNADQRRARSGGDGTKERARRARDVLRVLAKSEWTFLMIGAPDPRKVKRLRALAAEYDRKHPDEPLFQRAHGKLLSDKWFKDLLSDWQSKEIENFYINQIDGLKKA